MPECIFKSPDKRFIDALHYWQLIHKYYFKPELFRRNLNSLVQEIRNITFLIQKQKSDLEDFESWYKTWQNKLKTDRICKWSVKARNVVVKQGDLNTKSLAKVTITNDWLNEHTETLELSLSAKTESILRSIINNVDANNVSDESIVCIERLWIDSEFSDFEIIAATGHCLHMLSMLIQDAHANYCEKSKCEKLDQILEFSNKYFFTDLENELSRKLYIKLKELKTGDVQFKQTNFTPEECEGAKDRYGNIEIKTDSAPESLEHYVNHHLEASKIILKKDGYLLPVLHVLTKNNHIHQIGLIFEDRADKHIQLRNAAEYIRRIDAKYVILTGEAWGAVFDPSSNIMHAKDYPNRDEVVGSAGVSHSLNYFHMQCKFTRQNKDIIFQEPISGTHPINMLKPIAEALKHPSATRIVS
ncbi:MAG: hypothetical protein ACPGSB_04175 [Opitutales bacterium]